MKWREERIEWKKIPLKEEEDEDTSDSDDSSTGSDSDSSSSSEDGDDVMRSKQPSSSFSTPPIPSLGFTSASSLVSSSHSIRPASSSHFASPSSHRGQPILPMRSSRTVK